MTLLCFRWSSHDSGTLAASLYPRMQVSEFRKLVDSKIGDKHEELMSRMGAIMAGGLLDAGMYTCCHPACPTCLQLSFMQPSAPAKLSQNQHRL